MMLLLSGKKKMANNSNASWYVVFNSAILLNTKSSSPIGSMNLLLKDFPELADRTIKSLEEEGYKIKKREIK